MARVTTGGAENAAEWKRGTRMPAVENSRCRWNSVGF